VGETLIKTTIQLIKQLELILCDTLINELGRIYCSLQSASKHFGALGDIAILPLFFKELTNQFSKLDSIFCEITITSHSIFFDKLTLSIPDKIERMGIGMEIHKEGA